MTQFLTLKPWQLFGLLAILPMALQIITFGAAVSVNDTESIAYLFPVMMILIIGLFFSWLYSLGTNLYKKIPQTVTMNLTLFKIFLLIPVLYMFAVFVLKESILSSILAGIQFNPVIVMLLFPVHLLSVFGIFYCLYFNAKALKIAEYKKDVAFGDFAGEFFLFCFFPVGVWALQPRINTLFDKTMEG